MSGWNGGYVTDIDYTVGYYAFQAPAHLAAACMLTGHVTEIPARFEAMHYLELGCGHGLTAMALAAANPGWRVTGIDFNPTHVASARAVAAAAGLGNITFLEADLATFAGEPAGQALPPVDVVSMHGVWSWVMPEVRAGIVRLLREKLVAGGVVHVSYNALPGWEYAMGLQRLIYEAGRRTAGRADRQAEAGVALARELAATGATHLQHPFVKENIERLTGVPHAYTTHEFMNAGWAPCFQMDVAADMAGAKLSWAASARLLDNFDGLVLGAEQHKLAERYDDPLMRELIKDVSRMQGLRQDIFVRGQRRMSMAARRAAIGGLTIALTTPPARFIYDIRLQQGTASLNRAFYDRLIGELTRGPRAIGELLAMPDLPGEVDNPAEQLGMLVGTGQCTLIPRPGAAQSDAARRFNRLVEQRFGGPDQLSRPLVAVSPRLGGGVAINGLELAVLNRVGAGGAPDPQAWATEIGGPLADAERASLARTIGEILDARVPAWRHVGLL